MYIKYNSGLRQLLLRGRKGVNAEMDIEILKKAVGIFSKPGENGSDS